MFQALLNRFHQRSPRHHQDTPYIGPVQQEPDMSEVVTIAPEIHIIDLDGMFVSFREEAIRPTDEGLLKSRLITLARQALEQQPRTERDIANMLSISPKKIDALLKGDGSGFSIYRLFRILRFLGFKIKIVIEG